MSNWRKTLGTAAVSAALAAQIVAVPATAAAPDRYGIDVTGSQKFSADSVPAGRTAALLSIYCGGVPSDFRETVDQLGVGEVYSPRCARRPYENWITVVNVGS